MKLGTEVGLGPGLIVLDGDPPPPTKKGAQPLNFSAHVCCDQMAGWTKMLHDTEVGLSAGDFVLDGDPAPPRKKGTAPTQFSADVYCGQMAAQIKMPLGTEVNLYTGDVVLDGVTPLIGAQPPVFGPCLLWLRSAVSATAELLSLITVRC